MLQRHSWFKLEKEVFFSRQFIPVWTAASTYAWHVCASGTHIIVDFEMLVLQHSAKPRSQHLCILHYGYCKIRAREKFIAVARLTVRVDGTHRPMKETYSNMPYSCDSHQLPTVQDEPRISEVYSPSAIKRAKICRTQILVFSQIFSSTNF